MRGFVGILIVTAISSFPVHALDLNTFRAQHKRSVLSVSPSLSALAYEQAHAMAERSRIDHKDFRKRIGHIGSTHAENVLWGCEDESCAIEKWSKSGGHRANMLRGDISSYGIASASDEKGRKYWALELGGE
ncbi:MAG: CAP domain-containing protein [Pseudolabrys sp.]|nr:CAP domain-containing protein [Pseudolabrys sp.]